MNKTDIQLKQDVEDELSWEPKVNAAQIGVTVQHGAVTLMGAVDSYAEKWAAEQAVKRVDGVRAVAQELTVTVLGDHKHTDSEIAEAVLSALKWDVWVPKSISAQIQEGRVMLEGRVDWNYQRDAAVRAVSNLEGVTSVINAIKVKATASSEVVKEQVQAALDRQAKRDGNTIHVGTSGGTVTLSGSASSWHAIEEATSAAWSAPGVTDVVQNMGVVA